MSLVVEGIRIADLLREAIHKKTAKVGIVGMGYVGLPLAGAFIAAGYDVFGFDNDPQKVTSLKEGTSYIRHVSSDCVKSWLAEQRFTPTTDMLRLKEVDCILICVPTPLNESRDPDMSFIESTAQSIGLVLRPGQLVVLESTTYPGTTREVVLPILQQSRLKPGEDFFLAFSPEREDPGNATFTTSTIPKVVGGIDDISLELANSLYAHTVAKTVPVSSCEVAEACKIVENTYRCVNIAMVNELKVLFDRMGIDIWEVIEAAKTKPFGFQPFYPGPGLGGHCIPIDPFYLSWLARRHELSTRFIELAGEINTSMPRFVISKVLEALNFVGKPIRGSKVAVLGAAYKKDIDDPRESPSFKLMEILIEYGAVVSYNDPHIPVLPTMRHYHVPRLASEPLTTQYLASQDCVVIATDHSAYDWDFICLNSRLVIDTRNATKNIQSRYTNIWKA